MIRMKYILQSINLLNVLLSLVLAAMVYYVVIPFSHSEIGISLPAVKEKKAESYKLSALPPSTSPADYAVIGDQNLFHPERIVPPEKKEEKAVPRPDVILYGTLITDQESLAFVEDRKAPRTTPGRGKRQMALRRGDNLSGYILRDIGPSSIVLVKGDEKIVVLLEDGEKRKTAETPLLPAAAAMMTGGPQPSTPSASSPLPSPVPKVAPSPPPRVGPAGVDNPASWPTTRRGKLEEVQKRKAERQTAAP